MATKKDYFLVFILGVGFGLFFIPIFENIQPAFWRISFFSIIGLAIGFGLFAIFSLGVAGFLARWMPSIWQFAKYAAVGSFNSFLDLGILNFLSAIFGIYHGLWLAFFNVISFSIAVTNSYFWNKYWAFEQRNKLRASEYWYFISVTFIGALINTAIVYILTTLIGSPGGISPALWENIAKIIGVPAAILWNFFGYKFFVFKPKFHSMDSPAITGT